MSRYEYKVVPAPQKGLKAKGVKAGADRFAFALQSLMNDLASDGWEYQRAETLPSVERSGLTGSTTEWRNVLVFRRTLDTIENNDLADEPKLAMPLPAPTPADPMRADPPISRTQPAAEAKPAPEPKLELIQNAEKTTD